MNTASRLGIVMDSSCGGKGVCGKCRVRILEGNDGRPDSYEESAQTQAELAAGYRLACRYVPACDVTVEVAWEQDTVTRKTKLMNMPEGFILEPGVRRVAAELPAGEIGSQGSEMDKLKEICGAAELPVCGAWALQRLASQLKHGRELFAVLRDGTLFDVLPAKTPLYGLAVDIGTTTVVGMLWDLEEGKVVGIRAISNPQGVYGSDVISRINYASESSENLENIHRKITVGIQSLIEDFCREPGICRENICEIAAAGNTTMSHLLMKVDPGQLAVSPFAPVFTEAVSVPASELGLQVHPATQLRLLPNIAGHVGSDITAGILSTGMIRPGEVNLLIDIGTNGEIVLAGRGRVLACSTAAGPAFEGASISQGMRAAEGAIEAVDISTDGNPEIKTIGGGQAVGICGSGIIDGAARLLEQGIVDSSGKVLKPEKLREKGVPERLVSRIRGERADTEFVLSYGADGGIESRDVCITQKDIREVQLAKAAMYAGMKIMMKDLGVTEEDLNHVYIAGAFGSYIRMESALRIGLLPSVPMERIVSSGNAAGAGVSMALLSRSVWRKARIVARSIEHVELAVRPEFEHEYIAAMRF